MPRIESHRACKSATAKNRPMNRGANIASRPLLEAAANSAPPRMPVHSPWPTGADAAEHRTRPLKNTSSHRQRWLRGGGTDTSATTFDPHHEYE